MTQSGGAGEPMSGQSSAPATKPNDGETLARRPLPSPWVIGVGLAIATVAGIGLSLLPTKQITDSTSIPVTNPPPPPVGYKTFLIFFDWNQITLTQRAELIAKDAADYCANRAATECQHIDVDGNDDTSQSDAVAQSLSERRARVVAAALVRYGVPQDRISMHAYGSTKLLVPTAQGVREPQNRRVEIIVK